MATVAAGIPATDIHSQLLDYFRHHLHARDLAYAQGPVYIPNGWEAHVYQFRLSSRQPLPEDFTGPLVVRAYASWQGLERMRHEAQIQRHASRHGYPVARVLLVEEDDELFDGPFMVMKGIGGENLFDIMLHHWYTIWWAPARMAEVHYQLHQLKPPSSAIPSEPLWSRSLAALDSRIHDYGLEGLRPGLDWLDGHPPPQPDADCLLHLDFHPINLMFEGRRCTGVLDWGDWDVGDRHADLGTTLMLIKSSPVELPRPRHKIAAAIGKHWLASGYLQTYRKHFPIDENKLTCYTAWATLRRLCTWGGWLRVGPQITGGKPSSVSHIHPGLMERLCRLFLKLTGIAIRIG
jgi:aminoglycoside phosphotransferase (APT) family kinase protein